MSESFEQTLYFEKSVTVTVKLSWRTYPDVSAHRRAGKRLLQAYPWPKG